MERGLFGPAEQELCLSAGVGTYLERIARGEPGAVAACLDEYGSMILGLARRYLGPIGDDPEDAVQEIFIEVWKHASRFDSSQGTEPAFIATIAHRRLIDRQRKAAVRSAGPLDHRVNADPSAPPADLAAAVRDQAVMAAQVLRTLESDEQQVLWLSIYQGLSHERIAEHANIPLGTVKTRVRRGLQRLREALGMRPGDARAPMNRPTSPDATGMGGHS